MMMMKEFKKEEKPPVDMAYGQVAMKVGEVYDNVKLVFVSPVGNVVMYKDGVADVPVGVTAYFAMKGSDFVWSSVKHYHGLAAITGATFNTKTPDKGRFV
jgi:hypothetical protein